MTNEFKKKARVRDEPGEGGIKQLNRLMLLETKDVNEETVRGIYVEVKLR